MKRFFLLLLLLVQASAALAVIESYDFQDEAQRARYQQLTEELRCPKCQNQNLADSDSQIAADLRRELHAQLMAGQSDDAILAFMQQRYGDFVLYKPRLQRSTWLLWFGPVALAVLVLWFVARWRAASLREPTLPRAMPSDEPSLPLRRLPLQLEYAVVLLMLLTVGGAALLLYRHLGAGPALDITANSQALLAGNVPPAALPQQQTALLSQLDDWLVDHPTQEKFRYLRARVRAEAGLLDQAVEDYRQLVTQFSDQDNLLAEYAQLIYLKQGRRLDEDASAFLQQALTLNPQNVTALGLLGMQAFEQERYAEAVSLWQRLLVLMPPGSPQAETIAAGVARARERGHLPSEASPSSPSGAVASRVQLTLQVQVTAAAAARSDETVFVFLRLAGQRGMPLAAVRTTVAGLASPVRLDTAASPMRQGQPVPDGALEVLARLSRSGQPQASAGDWEGVQALPDRQTLSADQLITLLIKKPVVP